MYIADDFAGPTLDPDRWTEHLIGSVSLVIGVPSPGVYPQFVDDPGDEVFIESENKIVVPGAKNFESQIVYVGLYSDPTETIGVYFGWRSLQKTIGGDPKWGIDIIHLTSPGPTHSFQKRLFTSGVPSIITVGADPTNGADGGLKIVRSGDFYLLYYIDTGVWTLLESVFYPHDGPGYLIFGAVTGTPLLPFPWIGQT